MLDATQLGLYAQDAKSELAILRQTHAELVEKRDDAKAANDKRAERRHQADIAQVDQAIRGAKFRGDHVKWQKMQQVERDHYRNGGLSTWVAQPGGLHTLRFSYVDERGCTRPDYVALDAARRQHRKESPHLRWPASNFAERDPDGEAAHLNYENTGRTPFDESDEL